jgi:hypothetical protein
MGKLKSMPKQYPQSKLCKNCYGKGYRTVFKGLHGSPDFLGDKGFDVAPHIIIELCDCERGKMIADYFNIKRKYK